MPLLQCFLPNVLSEIATLEKFKIHHVKTN